MTMRGQCVRAWRIYVVFAKSALTFIGEASAAQPPPGNTPKAQCITGNVPRAQVVFMSACTTRFFSACALEWGNLSHCVDTAYYFHGFVCRPWRVKMVNAKIVSCQEVWSNMLHHNHRLPLPLRGTHDPWRPAWVIPVFYFGICDIIIIVLSQ